MNKGLVSLLVTAGGILFAVMIIRKIQQEKIPAAPVIEPRIPERVRPWAVPTR